MCKKSMNFCCHYNTWYCIKHNSADLRRQAIALATDEYFKRHIQV